MSITLQDAMAYKRGTDKNGFAHNHSEACLRKYDLNSSTEVIRYKDAFGEHEILTKPLIRCSVMIPLDAWSCKNSLLSSWLNDYKSEEAEQLLDRFCNCLVSKLHSKSNTLNLWSVESVSHQAIKLIYDTSHISITFQDFLNMVFNHVCDILKSVKDTDGNKVAFNEKCINIRSISMEFSPYAVDVDGNKIIKQSEFLDTKDRYRL